VIFACSVLFGLVIIYCFLFSLISTAFWFVRMDDVIELFESVYQAGRWPVSVYPDWMRSGLTFVVPISFAVTVPVETLLGQASVAVLVGQVVMAGCCLAFTRWFFTVALRRYTGASS
jgi:ABC-2 type transport system permease protein